MPEGRFACRRAEGQKTRGVGHQGGHSERGSTVVFGIGLGLQKDLVDSGLEDGDIFPRGTYVLEGRGLARGLVRPLRPKSRVIPGTSGPG